MGMGERIKHARQRKNLYQKDLGKLIGKDKSFISNAEKDKRPLKSEIVEKIAKSLDVTISYLYEGEELTGSNKEILKRTLMEMKENGQLDDLLLEVKPEYEFSPEIMELARELHENVELANFFKAAKKLINRSYALPNAAELLNIFAESLDEAHRREAEGRSDF